MEEFKAKLNKLLLQFPDLPECTFTIRPRITIDLATKEVPKKVLKDLLEVDMTAKTAKPEKGGSDVDRVMALEKGVTKARMAELNKSVSIQ